MSTWRAARLRLGDASVAVGALACVWGVASLAFLLIHAAVNGLTFAGADAVYFPADQLHYLAWIREAGRHGLIANPYRAGAAQLYLHPLFLISGLLWRAGLSVQAAYLVWTPLALIVLVWGYGRYTARFLAGGERGAALALALLFLSPLVPALDYGGIVDANGAYHLVTIAGHGAAYWQAWGYLPTVLALGLMPVFLTSVAALLRGSRGCGPVAATATAGLLVAWLHPWGGIELVVIVAALLALRRIPPGSGLVAVAAIGAALPLVYYAVIARHDPAWSLAQLRASGNAPLLWPLIFDYGPLLLVALPGLRRSRDPAEQLLALWPVAALLTYLVLSPDSRGTALEGVTLPLSILAVRGWRRLRVPRAWSYVALLVAIVPGALYTAHTFHDTFHNRDVPFALTAGEQRAVDALEPMQGNVFATDYLAPALPALDGHAGQITAGSDPLFNRLSRAIYLQRVIFTKKIRIVISDCLRGRVNLSPLLGPLGFRRRAYGCAQIYQRQQAERFDSPP